MWESLIDFSKYTIDRNAIIENLEQIYEKTGVDIQGEFAVADMSLFEKNDGWYKIELYVRKVEK